MLAETQRRARVWLFDLSRVISVDDMCPTLRAASGKKTSVTPLGGGGFSVKFGPLKNNKCQQIKMM